MLIDATTICHRFAALLKEMEKQGRIPKIEPALGYGEMQTQLPVEINKPLFDDVVLICKGVRKFVYQSFDVLMATTELPSTMMERFGDLLKKRGKEDLPEPREVSVARLIKISQAMVAFAKNYAAWNLLEDRPLVVVLGKGGFKLG